MSLKIVQVDILTEKETLVVRAKDANEALLKLVEAINSRDIKCTYKEFLKIYDETKPERIG